MNFWNEIIYLFKVFSSKIATNFSSLIENIKQQTPLATNNDLSRSPSQTSDHEETRSSRSQSQLTDDSLNASETHAVYEPKVQVKHKTRIRRAGKSSISQSTSDVKVVKEEMKEENDEEEQNSSVCLENLNKLLGG